MSRSSENSRVHQPRDCDNHAILRTERFADLEIQCDSQSWKVHKVVVCDRSTVLEKALTNEWREATENVYRFLDFNPAIVDRMLDYMYTGSYHLDDEKSSDALFHSLLANVEATEFLAEDAGINATVVSLFIHLEMNSIADFYDVYQLQEKATEGIRSILAGSWEQIAVWYPAFLEATFKKTTDTKPHSLLVDISLPHFNELDGSIFGRGVNLDVPASFFSDLLGRVRNEVASSSKKPKYEEMLQHLFQRKHCGSCERSDGFTISDYPEDRTSFEYDDKIAFVWDPEAQTISRKCCQCSYRKVL